MSNIRTVDPALWAAKDRKHTPLVVGVEVEEAVPGEHPVERLAERQGSHVPDDLLLVGQALATERDPHEGRTRRSLQRTPSTRNQGPGPSRRC